jgi:hypothetical protein
MRRVAAVAAAAALAGCYTIRYEHRGVAREAATRERSHHGAIGGFFDLTGPIRIEESCPSGAAAVESQITFPNLAAQLITSLPVLLFVRAPFWAPSTVRVACASGGVAGAAPSRKLKVALVPLAPLGGIDAQTAKVFDEAIAGELRKHPGVSVVTQSDVAALLGVERQRQLLGCTDAGCIAEIGGALGADRVVHGSVGRVGASLVVNLSSLYARRAAQAASVSERLRRADDEAFLDALPRIVDALLVEPAAPGGR